MFLIILFSNFLLYSHEYTVCTVYTIQYTGECFIYISVLIYIIKQAAVLVLIQIGLQGAKREVFVSCVTQSYVVTKLI